ncbi:MAG: hypothetical protein GY773_00900 [Actinomycetia bacterium]|nr:hypothetical protein [Actinomycetes bacterium]
MGARARDQTPFWEAIDRGETIAEAARIAGVHPSTGQKWSRATHRNDNSSRDQVQWFLRSGLDKDPRPTRAELPEPVPHAQLNAAAGHALTDFNFFSERYFGRVPTPWRLETAQRIFELYHSDEKEFVVVNAPPGSGKSVLFTHDIPAWLTCYNRAIRGVLGAWGITPAQTYTRNLRRTLERVAPAPFSDEDVTNGLGLEPVGVLATDFGRFKPLDSGEYWTATAFVVSQLDGRPVADKEPTWTAFGQGEILGWRVDLMIWDDLVTTRKLASEAEQERLRLWWDNEVEKRLEPGGLLVLQGQRLGANDLYRYCLDKVDVDDPTIIDLADDIDDPASTAPRKYHHVKFKAHYDDRCDPDSPDHSLSAAPYPEGCLLDPRRLRHRDLAREEANNPTWYATVYQQEDTAQDQILVPRVWIEGDEDHPGCWDSDRGGWEVPELAGRSITVISCDPSPRKMWAIQAWLVHPDSDQFFLLDTFRGQMTAEALLYYLHTGANVTSTTEFSGILEEWRTNYAHMGHPLRHVIVEKNVAQRFLLQYPHTRGWERKFSITIHDHETHHRNKADPDYGIQMLRPLFRHGKIRLPGLQAHAATAGRAMVRHNAAKLVSEITRYSLQFGPSGTDDQVMAAWFMAHKAQKLSRIDIEEMPRLYQDLPSWLNDEDKVLM